MVDAVHEHGALAGVELFYGSSLTSNRATREMPLSPSGLPRLQVGGRGPYPLHTRAMDKDDIRNLRTWQADAAKRAKSAGFDIVYVYAGMSFGPFQFISRRTNRRTDEYGGSLENRVRLLRRDGRGHPGGGGRRLRPWRVRFSVDELMGEAGSRVARRRARGVRAGRGAAGSVGSQDVRGAGQLECALLRGGLPGALRRVREADDLEAGGGRRAVHLARRHGVAGQARRARPHRRGLARPSRTPSCRRRSRRGGRTTSASASAATSATRATTSRSRSAAPRTPPWARSGAGAGIPNGSRGGLPAMRWLVVGAGPAGLEAARGARPARLRGHARRSGHRARRPHLPRVAPARTGHLDSRSGTGGGGSSTSFPASTCTSTAGSRRSMCWSSAFPAWWSPPAPAGRPRSPTHGRSRCPRRSAVGS